MARPALGRGLSALLGEPAATGRPVVAGAQAEAASEIPPAPGAQERIELVALTRIRPCPFQPRKDFPEEALRELADSIREQGIVQPLIVRSQEDHYELIAGERRWRAAQLAGLSEVPVLVRQATDAEALELALIENLQRENLNPIEEAQGYQQLIDLFSLRQEDVAAKVGKSRVVVANALRLLRLPPELQAYLRNGQLSVGHAKAVLGLTEPEHQKLAAERVIKAGLNVRQTEQLVGALQARAAQGMAKLSRAKVDVGRDPHVAAVENRLQERLGTRVRLRYRQGKGAVEIHFYSHEDLDRVLDVLGVKME
jgi:ParB family chromosome partitioning protein